MIGNAGKVDAVAAYRAADLRIHSAQIAVLVMRQRLILLLQRMRDTMRQTTQLYKQQGEDQQESEQITHGDTLAK